MQQPELHIAQVRHEVGSGHLLVRLITWGIVVGLIALMVIWWRGYLQWPSVMESGDNGSELFAETGGVLLEQAVSPPLPGMSDDEVPEADLSREGILRLPPQEEALPEDDTQEETSAADGEGSAQMRGAAERIGGAVAPAAEPEEAQPEPVASAAAASGVMLGFGGVSWVKIQDASGSFKLQGEMKAGTRRALGGTPPYTVVLGNANSVSITVAGKPFDLTPYIRGNVARFTLDPG
jgi:cytoskeleton protein RodZ